MRCEVSPLLPVDHLLLLRQSEARRFVPFEAVLGEQRVAGSPPIKAVITDRLFASGRAEPGRQLRLLDFT